MNLDLLVNNQKVEVQEATIRLGEEPIWSKPRGSRIRITSNLDKPRANQVVINIPGSGIFYASAFDEKYPGLVQVIWRGQEKQYKITKITGITKHWRTGANPNWTQQRSGTVLAEQELKYENTNHRSSKP